MTASPIGRSKVVARDHDRRVQQPSIPWSRKNVREFFVAVDARPSECVAAVQVVEDERVRSEFEQCDERLALRCLRGEVDGGDALARLGPPNVPR
jgi:hypothetical protein